MQINRVTKLTLVLNDRLECAYQQGSLIHDSQALYQQVPFENLARVSGHYIQPGETFTFNWLKNGRSQIDKGKIEALTACVIALFQDFQTAGLYPGVVFFKGEHAGYLDQSKLSNANIPLSAKLNLSLSDKINYCLENKSLRRIESKLSLKPKLQNLANLSAEIQQFACASNVDQLLGKALFEGCLAQELTDDHLPLTKGQQLIFTRRVLAFIQDLQLACPFQKVTLVGKNVKYLDFNLLHTFRLVYSLKNVNKIKARFFTPVDEGTDKILFPNLFVPPEIALQIIDQLPIKQVAELKQVSRVWQHLISVDNQISKKLATEFLCFKAQQGYNRYVVERRLVKFIARYNLPAAKLLAENGSAKLNCIKAEAYMKIARFDRDYLDKAFEYIKFRHDTYFPRLCVKMARLNPIYLERAFLAIHNSKFSYNGKLKLYAVVAKVNSESLFRFIEQLEDHYLRARIVNILFTNNCAYRNQALKFIEEIQNLTGKGWCAYEFATIDPNYSSRALEHAKRVDCPYNKILLLIRSTALDSIHDLTLAWETYISTPRSLLSDKRRDEILLEFAKQDPDTYLDLAKNEIQFEMAKLEFLRIQAKHNLKAAELTAQEFSSKKSNFDLLIFNIKATLILSAYDRSHLEEAKKLTRKVTVSHSRKNLIEEIFSSSCQFSVAEAEQIILEFADVCGASWQVNKYLSLAKREAKMLTQARQAVELIEDYKEKKSRLLQILRVEAEICLGN